MPQGPAARLTDAVMHLPPVLTGGPPAMNVLIGNLPAWKGIPLALSAGVQAAQQASEAVIKVAENAAVAAQAAAVAAAGTPGAPAAVIAATAARVAAEVVKASSAAAMGASIAAAAAGGASIHACTTPWPIPPHGPGVVIDGSKTVLINNMPACRLGDTIVEAIGPPNKIGLGCLTVMIGDSAGGGAVNLSVGGMQINGTPADQAAFLAILQREIQNSPTFSNEVLAMIQDTAHPVTFNVGRNNAPWVDSFANNNVDLNDIEWFERDPHPQYPWVQTQGEVVVHFLVERRHAAVNGGGFAAAHAAPLAPGGAQESYRTDRGQTGRVVSQVRSDDAVNPNRNAGTYTDDSGNQMIIRRDDSTGDNVPYEVEYRPAAPTAAAPGMTRTAPP